MAGLRKLIDAAKNSATFKRAKHASQHDLELLRQLVTWRKKRGLRQADVARIMGVSQQQISKFEHHDSDPKLSSLRRYANALELVIHHQILDDAGLKVSSPNDTWATGDAETVYLKLPLVQTESNNSDKASSGATFTGQKTDFVLPA